MKLAFSRPTGSSEEQRLLFSRFRSAGFDGLQLKGGQYSRYLEEPERFTEEWGEAPGAASALIAGGTLDDAGGDSLRRLFRFAAAVRAERIVFCHGVPRSTVAEGDIRDFARVLSRLGREAADLGVKLSLHHHYDQPVMHRSDFDVFFNEADQSAVGLTVDTAHLVKSGIHDIAEVIRTFHSCIDNLHLKDFAHGEFEVLGQGDIDFTPIFTGLGEIGYDGWLCADEESGSEMLASLRLSRAFLRRCFAAVHPTVERCGL